jgi:acetyl esterase
MPLDPPAKTILEEAAALGLPAYQDLSPKHRHPAAVEDAYTATNWAAENSDVIQADPDRLAVGGDNAGGHLAAVVTMMARDRKGPSIDLQVLIYPITDCNFNTPSYTENKEG